LIETFPTKSKGMMILAHIVVVVVVADVAAVVAVVRGNKIKSN